MDSKPNETETNEDKLSKEKDLYESLDDKHKRAVDMRLEFYKYKYIASELKVSEQTVKLWFMEGGMCKEAYIYKKKQRAREYAEMLESARQEIKDLVPEAVIVVRDALTRKNKDGVDAAFKVLGIQGISVIEKQEVDDKNKDKLDSYSNLLDSIAQDVKRLSDTSDKKTDPAV